MQNQEASCAYKTTPASRGANKARPGKIVYCIH